MSKPLVISRSYLWGNSAVGQIQRVFWEYLYDKGVRPTIICTDKDQNNVPIDSLKCSIIQTRDNQIIRYIIAFLKRTLAEDFAYLPDYPIFSWYPSAKKKAVKEATKGVYDYIFSVCTPYASHLIALEAKRKSGLPWVAWFYDPWFDNPYRPFKYKRFYERDRKNEEAVAKNADVIIHSNQAIYNEWVERYGESIKDKMYIVPFVFNTNRTTIKQKDKDKRNGVYIISHIGSLYPNRDSSDFLKALNMVIEAHPEVKAKVELNYVGNVTDNDRELVKHYNLSDITNFAGVLSEEACQEYFVRSDLFLAIDGKNSRNIFFPSKIMKYFYYGKPILGLTPRGSALQYELEQSKNFCFENDDIGNIADFLYRSIVDDNYPKGNDVLYWKNFTMDNIYPQYISIIEKSIEKR